MGKFNLVSWSKDARFTSRLPCSCTNCFEITRKDVNFQNVKRREAAISVNRFQFSRKRGKNKENYARRFEVEIHPSIDLQFYTE